MTHPTPTVQTAFDYGTDFRHSQFMGPGQCDHTLHHVDKSGVLDGSWTTDPTEHVSRVICSSCGKLYGYLAHDATLPIARPALSQQLQMDGGTGSSSRSPAQLDGLAAEDDTSFATTMSSRQRFRRRGIDYNELRRRVTIAQVLELAGWKPLRREVGRTQLRGACPVHGSQDTRGRVFSVNSARNIFRCFKCGAGGNQLDLWFTLSSLPPYEAAIDLCDRLRTDVPWLNESHTKPKE